MDPIPTTWPLFMGEDLIQVDVPTTTWRRTLTGPNPSVTCKPSFDLRHKTKQDVSEKLDHEGALTFWEDFELATLNKDLKLADALDSPIILGPEKTAESEPSINIDKSHEITRLIERNDRILLQALKHAKSEHKLCDGVQLNSELSPTSKSAKRKRGEVEIESMPKRFLIEGDHLIYLDTYPRKCLVVGIGRPTWEIQGLSGQLLGHNQVAVDARRPLEQLMVLCREAGTKYGYIQTAKYLVACRFASERGSISNNVAFKVVPWTTEETTNLTTDLALWWLSMRAILDYDHEQKAEKERQQQAEKEHQQQAETRESTTAVNLPPLVELHGESVDRGSEVPDLGNKAMDDVHYEQDMTQQYYSDYGFSLANTGSAHDWVFWPPAESVDSWYRVSPSTPKRTGSEVYVTPRSSAGDQEMDRA